MLGLGLEVPAWQVGMALLGLAGLMALYYNWQSFYGRGVDGRDIHSDKFSDAFDKGFVFFVFSICVISLVTLGLAALIQTGSVLL